MKLKLAVLNLFISQSLILAFLTFAYFIWFPHSLSEFIGFSRSAKIITLVNIVLGPILLVIVYKKHKKNLKLDITILLIIQLSAIIYGAKMLYEKHPSYAVFTIDRFTLVNSASSEPEKIQFKELETSIFSKTKLAFARLPTDIDKRNELVISTMDGKGRDLDKRHEYFEPYSEHVDYVKNKSINTQKLFSSGKSLTKLNNFLDKYAGAKDDYLYLPLQSNSKDVVWVLDKHTAQPVGIIDVDPWQ